MRKSHNDPVIFDGKRVPDKLLCEVVWMARRTRNLLKKATWTRQAIQDHITVEGWEYIRERLDAAPVDQVKA